MGRVGGRGVSERRLMDDGNLVGLSHSARCVARRTAWHVRPPVVSRGGSKFGLGASCGTNVGSVVVIVPGWVATSRAYPGRCPYR